MDLVKTLKSAPLNGALLERLCFCLMCVVERLLGQLKFVRRETRSRDCRARCQSAEVCREVLRSVLYTLTLFPPCCRIRQ